MRICLSPTGRNFACGVLAASAACLALGLAGCKADPVERAIDPQLLAFEKGYSQGLPYKSKAGVKLIGFKTITIPDEAIEQFDTIYQANRAKLRHYYLDKPSRILRVYFPVESALVEVDGGVLEASTLGELDIAPADPALRTIGVIGRQQTPSIRGVQGNIIKDGVIYLAQKNVPDHVSGELLVFDFGIKLLMEHGAHGGGEVLAGKGGRASVDTFDGGAPPPADLRSPTPLDMGSPPPPADMSSPPPADMSSPPPPSDLGQAPDLGEACTVDTATILAVRRGVGSRSSALAECEAKANCMTNHGGPNCSNAFGINKGRCPFNAAVCMDYNGIATNCVNAGSGFWKYWNFPDSDCDVALAMGHCWNELM